MHCGCRGTGVAIGTIRKAVDSLVAERALVRRQGKGTFVTAHEGSRLYFHFFHIVAPDGRKVLPEVRTIAFRRDRADRATAEALGIAPHDKFTVIRLGIPLEADPGTRAEYSDLGFILLGFVLERAGASPLDEQFRALAGGTESATSP